MTKLQALVPPLPHLSSPSQIQISSIDEQMDDIDREVFGMLERARTGQGQGQGVEMHLEDASYPSNKNHAQLKMLSSSSQDLNNTIVSEILEQSKSESHSLFLSDSSTFHPVNSGPEANSFQLVKILSTRVSP